MTTSCPSTASLRRSSASSKFQPTMTTSCPSTASLRRSSASSKAWPKSSIQRARSGTRCTTASHTCTTAQRACEYVVCTNAYMSEYVCVRVCVYVLERVYICAGVLLCLRHGQRTCRRCVCMCVCVCVCVSRTTHVQEV